MTPTLLLALAAPALAQGSQTTRKTDAVVEPYQPFVFLTTARSNDVGRFAIELGGGYDGLRPPEEEEEDEDDVEGDEAALEGQRSAVWWESAVGLGGGVQLETAVQLGDRPEGFGLTQGRAEVRVELIPRRIGSPVDVAVGAGWAVDVLADHAVTGVVAATGHFGRVTAAVDTRLAHVFDPDRDPLDVEVAAGALVRATDWLQAGLEYTGRELEEPLGDEGAVDGGGRHYLGPTLAVGLARQHVRLALTGGVVLAAWGVGPLVQGSAAWRF